MLQRVFQSMAGVDTRNQLTSRPEHTYRIWNPYRRSRFGPVRALLCGTVRKTTDLGEAWSKFSFLDPLWLGFHGIFNLLAYFSLYHVEIAQINIQLSPILMLSIQYRS